MLSLPYENISVLLLLIAGILRKHRGICSKDQATVSLPRQLCYPSRTNLSSGTPVTSPEVIVGRCITWIWCHCTVLMLFCSMQAKEVDEMAGSISTQHQGLDQGDLCSQLEEIPCLGSMTLPVLSQHADSCCCELPAWGSKEVLGMAWPGVCCHFFPLLGCWTCKEHPPHGIWSWEPPPAWSLNKVLDATEGMQYRSRSYPPFSGWGLSIGTLWDLTSVLSTCVISAGSRGGIQALVQLPRCSMR